MTDIAHVVVLMLENRSYDHLLGYVPHPDPTFDGLLGRGFTNPGWGRGRRWRRRRTRSRWCRSGRITPTTR